METIAFVTLVFLPLSTVSVSPLFAANMEATADHLDCVWKSILQLRLFYGAHVAEFLDILADIDPFNFNGSFLLACLHQGCTAGEGLQWTATHSRGGGRHFEGYNWPERFQKHIMTTNRCKYNKRPNEMERTQKSDPEH